jgi:hypothetical protein
MEPPGFAQRFRHWLRGDGTQYGCAYCADDANRSFGHVEQVASSEESGLLLRCPRCGSLYQNAGDGGYEKRLTSAEAEVAFPSWVGPRDIGER